MTIRYVVHGSSRDQVETAAQKPLLDFLDLDNGEEMPEYDMDIYCRAITLWSGEVATWEADVTVVLPEERELT